MVELHLPVMEREVIEYLVSNSEGIYIDATLGDGGHAEAICRQLSSRGMLIGLDWDEAALDRAKDRLTPFENKIKFIHESYTHLSLVLQELAVEKVDGILIDLGASTLQLMDPKRGFSFHHEGELDMRMDRRQSLTAKEIINNYTAEQLSEIFFRYGEERWSKKMAARIVSYRESEGPFNDSRQLATLMISAMNAYDEIEENVYFSEARQKHNENIIIFARQYEAIVMQVLDKK